MRALLPLVIALAGCVAPRTAFPPIARMHSPTLCYIEYAGNVLEQQAARAELDVRRFQCTESAIREGSQQWANMASADRDLRYQDNASRNRAANAAFGLGLMLMAVPPPPLPPPPVVCHTQGPTTICR